MIGRPPRPMEQRLFARVSSGPNSCWSWTGGGNNGYGTISTGGPASRNVYVHRAVYELMVGQIPEGLELDHLCRNRACVNPEHLDPVPPRINSLRGEGISAVNARRTHCSQGHPFDHFNGSQRICKTCRREVHRRYRLKKKAIA